MSGHIRYREYFGRREILIMVLAFIATALTNLISLRLPVELEPYLALCPVIGLLFGPLGIIGVGHVGSLVKSYAELWGFRVLCCDPPREDEPSRATERKYFRRTKSCLNRNPTAVLKNVST